MLLAYAVLIIPISHFLGTALAIVAFLVVVVVVYLTLSTPVHAKSAPSALQRLVSRDRITVSILLFGAGSTGVEFSLPDQNRVTIPVGGGPGLRLPVKLAYGGVNPLLIGTGVLCFPSTLGVVVLLDHRAGWLSRDTPKEGS